MSSWLKAAGNLLEAVDRTAQKVSTSRDGQQLSRAGDGATTSEGVGAALAQGQV